MNQDPLRHWPVSSKGVEKNIKQTYIGTIFVPNHNPPSLRAKKDRQVLLLLGSKVKAEKREDRTKTLVEGICHVKQKKRDTIKRADIKPPKAMTMKRKSSRKSKTKAKATSKKK